MAEGSKQNWFKRHKVLSIIGVIVIIGILASASEGDKSPSNSAKNTTSSSSEKKNSTSLADETQKAYLKSVGYNSIPELNLDKDNVVGSPENEIVKFEDAGSGDVRVYVQDDISKDQAKQVGRMVMASASDLKNLQWVIVQGTDGLDVNVSRQDAGVYN